MSKEFLSNIDYPEDVNCSAEGLKVILQTDWNKFFTKESAVQHLTQSSGVNFGPRILRIFSRLLKKEGIIFVPRESEIETVEFIDRYVAEVDFPEELKNWWNRFSSKIRKTLEDSTKENISQEVIVQKLFSLDFEGIPTGSLEIAQENVRFFLQEYLLNSPEEFREIIRILSPKRLLKDCMELVEPLADTIKLGPFCGSVLKCVEMPEDYYKKPIGENSDSPWRKDFRLYLEKAHEYASSNIWITAQLLSGLLYLAGDLITPDKKNTLSPKPNSVGLHPKVEEIFVTIYQHFSLHMAHKAYIYNGVHKEKIYGKHPFFEQLNSNLSVSSFIHPYHSKPNEQRPDYDPEVFNVDVLFKFIYPSLLKHFSRLTSDYCKEHLTPDQFAEIKEDILRKEKISEFPSVEILGDRDLSIVGYQTVGECQKELSRALDFLIPTLRDCYDSNIEHQNSSFDRLSEKQVLLFFRYICDYAYLFSDENFQPEVARSVLSNFKTRLNDEEWKAFGKKLQELFENSSFDPESRQKPMILE